MQANTKSGQIRRFATKALMAVTAASLSIAVGAGSLSSGAVQAHELDLPDGFVGSTIITDLVNPVGMELGPDGRIYVLDGRSDRRISVIDEANGTRSTWLELPGAENVEMGVHGITWHPDFANEPYVYVSYIATATDTAPQRYELNRYEVVGDDPVESSKSTIFTINDWNPGQKLHQGGDLAFGADGKLYWALGDRVTTNNVQSFTSFAGKLLRLNDDGSIPADNPFVEETTGKRQAIYALGLRNPWRVETRPSTGDLYISSVGPQTWEELDVAAAGVNYGWPIVSGPSTDPAYTNAAWSYPHVVDGAPLGCAITGGAFMPETTTNPVIPGGSMLIGDHCFGWIDIVDVDAGTSTRFTDGLERLIDIVIDPTTGAIYYLDREYDHDDDNQSGGIGRIDYNPSATLSISTQPQDVTSSTGRDATLSVEASGQPPVSYQWFRDGAQIDGETSATLTLTDLTVADSGASFSVTVSDAASTVTSESAIVTVAPNESPVLTIDAPVGETLWTAGDTISYSGSAVDPEDGTLPDSALTWDIVFHHNTHTHPFIDGVEDVSSGTFVIPTTGETAPDIWYRVYLTATDTQGVSSTIFRDIFPITAQITIDSTPSGATLLLDSQPIVTPYTFTGVAGIDRELEAPSQQDIAGQALGFDSWSGGQNDSFTLVTPGEDTTITATYLPIDASFTCSVDGTTLSWTDQGIDKYFIRQIVQGQNEYVGVAVGVLDYQVPATVGSYQVVAFVGGTRTTTDCQSAAVFECVVDGGVLSWTDVSSKKYHVRQVAGAGSTFLATVTDALSYDVPDSNTYQVVIHVSGTRVVTECSGSAGFVCAVNGSTLSWTAQEASTYFVRRLVGSNNEYLDTVTNANTFALRDLGGVSRVVTFVDGERLVADCAPAEPPLFACSVTAGTISWTSQDTTTFYVRRLEGNTSNLVSVVANATSYDLTDTPGAYEVVGYLAGQRTTTACSS